MLSWASQNNNIMQSNALLLGMIVFFPLSIIRFSMYMQWIARPLRTLDQRNYKMCIPLHD